MLLHKIKIAYFLDVPKGLGGAGNLLLQQARVMSKLFDVLVVVPSDGKGTVNEEYIRRCRINYIPYRVLEYNTSFNFYNVDFLGALKNKETIKNFAIQEQITFFHSVQLNIVVEFVARELHIPHLMNIYQLSPDEFKIKYGDIYPQYHLCDSEMYSKLWSEKLKIPSRCVRPVAPLGKMEKKSTYNLDNFTIVMLGSVCSRKNQLTAIKAVEKCLDKYDIKLKIAGEEEKNYAQLCKDYIRDRKLEANIQFLGFVKDVSGILKQSNCLLCASVDESFPSSIVEAVTYDLTIVTTPVAGVPEIFKNNCNSFVSDDFSVSSIQKSLEECLNSYIDGKIIKIHLNEEYTWEKYFSPDKVGKQIERYYKDIIDDFILKKDDGIDEVVKVVKDTFELLQPVYKNNHLVKRRCLYYSFLKEKLQAGRAYIWGAGEFGKLAKEILEIIKPDIEIIGFIDRNKRGMYLELPIIYPQEIQYLEVEYIFIGFAFNREEAIEFLREKQFGYNEKVWILP